MTKFETIKELLAYWEQPDYRYRQICQAVFRQRLSRFREMTILPGELRERLTETFAGTLRRAGIRCSVRTQFGADISAACGQLCGR